MKDLSKYPVWFRILNLDETEFSKQDNKWQLNKYDALMKIAPDLYESTGKEVKEFNDYHVVNGNSFDKVKLGRKIGSIAINDWFLHPELMKDSKALRKYWQLHPELKAQRFSKTGNLANGPGFKV